MNAIRVCLALPVLSVLMLGGCPDTIPLPGLQEGQSNLNPQANAGPDITTTLGQVVTLSAAASNDPDGDALSYQWARTYGQEGELQGATSMQATFVALAEGTYEFTITVNDGRGGFDQDTVRVNVGSSASQCSPPMANAGPDQSVNAGQPVILQGGGSADPSGAPLQYLWNQVQGPAVPLTGASSVTASFNAPNIATAVTLVFELTVTNGCGRSAGDSVAVIVQPASPPPPPPSTDRDGDGVPDDEDGCPNDASKTVPGACGCGVPETDSDSDGTPDCTDGCPSDPLKIAPGTCGCGAPDSAACGEEVTLTGAWSNTSGSMHIDIHWQLPSGEWMEVERSGWAEQGAESVSLSKTAVPPGFHWLVMNLYGSGRFADVRYTVDFLDYQFTVTRRMSGDARRAIGLDVANGQARVVYNGWLEAADADSGSATRRHAFESIAAWRNGSNDVHADLHVLTPTGEYLQVWRHGWALQGMERALLPADVNLDEGTYTLEALLYGSGRWADVAWETEFLGTRIRHDERLQGGTSRVLGYDVKNGQARVVYDGWLASGSAGAAQLAGDHALEVLGGWRNASKDMHVDVDVKLPDGQWLGVSRYGWALQGFERVVLPADVATPDGTYTLVCKLFGSGRWTDVDYQVKLGDWSFVASERLSGDRAFTILVKLTGGHATVLSNGWEE
ncbi:MAG: hypothetical protein AMXMBFR13_09750 [Phycisphaerae bacterium]